MAQRYLNPSLVLLQVLCFLFDLTFLFVLAMTHVGTEAFCLVTRTDLAEPPLSRANDRLHQTLSLDSCRVSNFVSESHGWCRMEVGSDVALRHAGVLSR